MPSPVSSAARKRSQATAILNDARVIDGAVDQYAIENNMLGSSSVTVQPSVLKGFFKPNSRLYQLGWRRTRSSDILGNVLTPTRRSTAACMIATATRKQLLRRDHQQRVVLGRLLPVNRPLQLDTGFRYLHDALSAILRKGVSLSSLPLSNFSPDLFSSVAHA